MLVLPAFTWQTSHRTAMLPMCNQTSTSWRKVGPQHTLLSHGWKLHYLQILTTDQLNTHYFHTAESFIFFTYWQLTNSTHITFTWLKVSWPRLSSHWMLTRGFLFIVWGNTGGGFFLTCKVYGGIYHALSMPFLFLRGNQLTCTNSYLLC